MQLTLSLLINKYTKLLTFHEPINSNIYKANTAAVCVSKANCANCQGNMKKKAAVQIDIMCLEKRYCKIKHNNSNMKANCKCLQACIYEKGMNLELQYTTSKFH